MMLIFFAGADVGWFRGFQACVSLSLIVFLLAMVMAVASNIIINNKFKMASAALHVTTGSILYMSDRISTCSEREGVQARSKGGGALGQPPAEQNLLFSYFPVKLGSCEGTAPKKTFLEIKFFSCSPSSRAG